MTQFEKFFIQIFDDRYQEAEEKGTKAEKVEVAKRMLKMNMKDKEILYIARIDKNELQKLKQELKVC